MKKRSITDKIKVIMEKIFVGIKNMALKNN